MIQTPVEGLDTYSMGSDSTFEWVVGQNAPKSRSETRSKPKQQSTKRRTVMLVDVSDTGGSSESDCTETSMEKIIGPKKKVSKKVRFVMDSSRNPTVQGYGGSKDKKEQKKVEAQEYCKGHHPSTESNIKDKGSQTCCGTSHLRKDPESPEWEPNEVNYLACNANCCKTCSNDKAAGDGTGNEANAQQLCDGCKPPVAEVNICTTCKAVNKAKDKVVVDKNEKKQQDSTCTSVCTTCGGEEEKGKFASKSEKKQESNKKNSPIESARKQLPSDQKSRRNPPQHAQRHQSLSKTNTANTSRIVRFASQVGTFRQQLNMVKRVIKPSRGEVVLREDVIECPSDPRPNAFFDTRTGVLRVYHGPVYGNPLSTLIPLSSTMATSTSGTNIQGGPPPPQYPRHLLEKSDWSTTDQTHLPGAWVNDDAQKGSGQNATAGEAWGSNQDSGWNGDKSGPTTQSNNNWSNGNWGGDTNKQNSDNQAPSNNENAGWDSGGNGKNGSTGWGNETSNTQDQWNGTTGDDTNQNNTSDWGNAHNQESGDTKSTEWGSGNINNSNDNPWSENNSGNNDDYNNGHLKGTFDADANGQREKDSSKTGVKHQHNSNCSCRYHQDNDNHKSPSHGRRGQGDDNAGQHRAQNEHSSSCSFGYHNCNIGGNNTGGQENQHPNNANINGKTCNSCGGHQPWKPNEATSNASWGHTMTPHSSYWGPYNANMGPPRFQAPQMGGWNQFNNGYYGPPAYNMSHGMPYDNNWGNGGPMPPGPRW